MTIWTSQKLKCLLIGFFVISTTFHVGATPDKDASQLPIIDDFDRVSPGTLRFWDQVTRLDQSAYTDNLKNSIWGGGQLSGILTVVNLPISEVEQMLRPKYLRIPRDYKGKTYPVVVVLGQQVGVHAMNHRKFKLWPRMPILENYREVAFMIPGVIHEDRYSQYEPVEVTYLSRVFLTDFLGAQADRGFIGLNMKENGFNAAIRGDGDTIDFNSTAENGLLTVNAQAKPLTSATGISTKNQTMSVLSLMLGQPIIGFPAQQTDYPWPVMFGAMVMDPEQLMKSKLVDVSLQIDAGVIGQESKTATKQIKQNGLVGFALDNVGWTMLTHFREYSEVMSHPAYQKLVPWGRRNGFSPRNSYVDFLQNFQRNKNIFPAAGAQRNTLAPSSNNQMEPKKILILGGSGSIGAGLVEFYARQGNKVTVVGQSQVDNLKLSIDNLLTNLAQDRLDVKYESLDLAVALAGKGTAQTKLQNLLKDHDVTIQAAERYPLTTDAALAGEAETKKLIELLKTAGYVKNGRHGRKHYLRIGSPVEVKSDWRAQNNTKLLFNFEHQANNLKSADLISESSRAAIPSYQLPYFSMKVKIAELYRDSGLAMDTFSPPRVISPYSDHGIGETPLLAYQLKTYGLVDFPTSAISVYTLASLIEKAINHGPTGSYNVVGGTPVGEATLTQAVFAQAGLKSGPSALVESIFPPEHYLNSVDQMISEGFKLHDAGTRNAELQTGLLVTALSVEMNRGSQGPFAGQLGTKVSSDKKGHDQSVDPYLMLAVNMWASQLMATGGFAPDIQATLKERQFSKIAKSAGTVTNNGKPASNDDPDDSSERKSRSLKVNKCQALF